MVLALHAGVLWGLWQQRLIPAPQEAATLFVNFMAAPTPKAEEPAQALPPRPQTREKSPPRQLLAATPVSAAADDVTPQPPLQPVQPIEAPPAPAPTVASPVAIASELSVVCPEHAPPAYPSIARRMGEEGTVILRVELDERGRVALAKIATGSGHPRLDEAALAAIQTWRCTPAQRDGQPLRATALQPIKFILQGN